MVEYPQNIGSKQGPCNEISSSKTQSFAPSCMFSLDDELEGLAYRFDSVRPLVLVLA